MLFRPIALVPTITESLIVVADALPAVDGDESIV
jgi:hypothetical protein